MIELLRNRRSVRKFKQDRIEAEKIEILKEAAVRSPSSRNFDPWRFVFVQDGGTIEKLARCKKHGSAFMIGAPLGIVVLADESKSDVWVEDCSIASILIQLVAQSLELGSCWVQVRNRFTADEKISSEDYIKGVIGIDDENIRVESIIAVGYPDEIRTGKDFSELEFEKITDLK